MVKLPKKRPTKIKKDGIIQFNGNHKKEERLDPKVNSIMDIWNAGYNTALEKVKALNE